MRPGPQRPNPPGQPGRLESLRTVSGDITAAGNVGALVLEPDGAQELLVHVQLAEAQFIHLAGSPGKRYAIAGESTAR